MILVVKMIKRFKLMVIVLTILIAGILSGLIHFPGYKPQFVELVVTDRRGILLNYTTHSVTEQNIYHTDTRSVPTESFKIVPERILKTLPFCSHTSKQSRWDFNCKNECLDLFGTYSIKSTTRRQLEISCTKNSTIFAYTKINTTNMKIPSFDFNDDCLRRTLSKNCWNDKPVPNIVHYIWFGRKEVSFYHFISFWSVHIKLRPCVVLIHGDHSPFGKYWDLLVRHIPNLIHIRKKPSTSIFGRPILIVEHRADVARLEAVRDFGGIYLDTDEVILRNLDTLRQYNFTLSHAYDYNLSNGLILSTRNATFIKHWLNQYRSYEAGYWGYHSTIIPYKLSKEYPSLIHVENKTFVNPDYQHVNQIFKENFNWSKNFAIHLFIRKYNVQHNFTDIRRLNTTLGSVGRHVLFGSKELCSA